jgi:hypothetical protein
LAQIGSIQLCAAEVGPLQARTSQARIPQVGLNQIGILELAGLAATLLQNLDDGLRISCQHGLIAPSCCRPQAQNPDQQVASAHGRCGW